MLEFEPDEESITGINVTPLVDIILVLLIIFMVTARFISEPSLGVKLPKSSAGSKAEISENNVFLTIDDQRRIFLNNNPVSREELKERIRALIQEKPNLNLVLRADKTISHGEVISILDQVRSEGVTQFGIAVESATK